MPWKQFCLELSVLFEQCFSMTSGMEKLSYIIREKVKQGMFDIKVPLGTSYLDKAVLFLSVK